MTISDLTFRSKKQETTVLNKLLTKRPDAYYKLHKQWMDGSITLHRFFKNDGKWLGYALTVGTRGGEKAYHKCYVVEVQDGTHDLHHS